MRGKFAYRIGWMLGLCCLLCAVPPAVCGEAAGPAARTFTNTIGMTFVHVPPAAFTMGSPEAETGRDVDETALRVTLTRGFYIQTTEVTQGQWQRVMGSNPSTFADCGENCPVETVSWQDCQAFVRAVNRIEKTEKYRLPTEAEWEFACRAGSDTPYSAGPCLHTDRANFNGNYVMPGCEKGMYRKTTVAVGSFPPNAWGLYDMHGNVWEWCQDRYGAYPETPVTDPAGAADGLSRVNRGGSWYSLPANCRSAKRGHDDPAGRYRSKGLRLVMAP